MKPVVLISSSKLFKGDVRMEFVVNGTLIEQYYICKREVWLTTHNLSGDQDNENLVIGRIIEEFSYKREKKQVDLGNAKIDLLRTEDGQVIIGEVKKSSKFINSASRQLLFYLLQLKEMGIEARGELLIPEEKKKIEVVLDEARENEIKNAIEDIEKIASCEFPPEPVMIKYCRKCAYGEFCWA